MSKPEAIFIDWNGTLSKSFFWEGSALRPALETSLFKNHAELINPWMRGEYTVEQISEIISPDIGISPQECLALFQQSCEQMVLISPLIPGFILELQKHGTSVVIATDNMDTFFRWTVPALHLDTIFDSVLNSHDLNVLKDDFGPEGQILFFKRYMEKSGLTPTDCILIDDSKNTCRLYSEHGFTCLLVSDQNDLVTHLRGIVDKIT